MDIEHPDTTPGFEMESPSFVLTFVTGLQRGVESSMLEMDTDWYTNHIHIIVLVAFADDHHALLLLALSNIHIHNMDDIPYPISLPIPRFEMMEIILSRLEDQPTNQGQFEVKPE